MLIYDANGAIVWSVSKENKGRLKMKSLMHHFFYNILCKEKIAKMQTTIDVYRERNDQLEKEVETLKEFRFKYKIAKMYIDDAGAARSR